LEKVEQRLKKGITRRKEFRISQEGSREGGSKGKEIELYRKINI